MMIKKSRTNQEMMTLLPNHSLYKYFKVKRLDLHHPNIPQTPEMLATYAIERLILMEDVQTIKFPEIELHITSLANVILFILLN